MKYLHTFFVFGILLCLYSCSDDSYEPYEPTEWRYDKYSDSSILPGDDFYRFVCGNGIATEGSDSLLPLSCWVKQQIDYESLAFGNGDDNPVPVIKRLNELKTAISSGEHIAEAFASMRERLNGINERTVDMGFPEKAAEYYRNGYSLFYIIPLALDGHEFGFEVSFNYEKKLDWTEQQLMMAGIKEEYDNLLPKALMFKKYLLANINDDGESIQNLDATIPEQCRLLKAYVETSTSTKTGSSAIERFATAIGNHNPVFVPADDDTRRFFELVDKIEDAEMKEAADAFLWCEAVSFDMAFILEPNKWSNPFIVALYPNLLMNISHTFCDMYAKPECAARNREIFESLRKTMAERIDQSEWMTPYSKAVAREKINAMECHTGILDWSKYEADIPVSDEFCSALHEVGSSYLSKLMAISGENNSLDHVIALEYMTLGSGVKPYSANSFYMRTHNAMCILPSTSVLTDMNPEYPLQTYIVAHELCHGFDAEGAYYDARGQLGDWWSIDDKLEFKKKQEQLIGIFNHYYVGDTMFCNGAKTINEDMADLGGLEIAYYTTVRELEKKITGDELQEMKRRFFKSYAVFFAKYYSFDEKLKLVEADVHSLVEYRTNGIVNNIDDWYQLFDVTPARKFYLSPQRRVHLW